LSAEYFRSPVGTLKIVSDGRAIKEIALVKGEKQNSGDNLTAEAVSQLKEYFDGKRTDFIFPIAPDGTDFQKKVWDVLLKIPYGKHLTYGEVAELAGNKNACRAVGNAVGKNPILIAIPCHRVTASDGIGGFSAGIEIKKYLLNKENIIISKG